jgi:hypothetical protein
VGGMNSSVRDLQVRGNTQLDYDAKVNRNLTVGNDFFVGGTNSSVFNLTVRGGANVLSDFQVGGGGRGNLVVNGNTEIRGGANVLGDFQVGGDGQPHTLSLPARTTLVAGLGNVRAEAPVAGGESRSVLVQCPAGKGATSGGFDITLGGSPTILASRPLPTNDGWEVYAANAPGAANITVRVYAVCSQMR